MYSNIVRRNIQRHIWGKAGAQPLGTNFWVTLSTTDPAQDGQSITEPVGNGYAAVATVPADWLDASLANPSVMSNATIIDFGTATGPWGLLTHYAVWDHATLRAEANFMGAKALTTAMSPVDTNPVSFPIGSIIINLLWV